MLNIEVLGENGAWYKVNIVKIHRNTHFPHKFRAFFAVFKAHFSPKFFSLKKEFVKRQKSFSNAPSCYFAILCQLLCIAGRQWMKCTIEHPKVNAFITGKFNCERVKKINERKVKILWGRKKFSPLCCSLNFPTTGSCLFLSYPHYMLFYFFYRARWMIYWMMEW